MKILLCPIVRFKILYIYIKKYHTKLKSKRSFQSTCEKKMYVEHASQEKCDKVIEVLQSNDHKLYLKAHFSLLKK